ncbi:cystine-binding periplasmic protein precursor [Clostridium oryzae]|uniref:Cystine-binding periplasmic protein n=1 Tax=Clostridium oryzae TaxID=1450648 RepID=A0A1V4IZ03_9CLOT|nr:cystine-binding periplasmic protein precursor [Clostridium oryzae]
MKKIISLILCLITVPMLIVGCSKGETGSKSALDKIKASKVMTIGMEDTYAPMEFKDSSNKLVGFDIDMANAIAKKMGVKVKWVSISWDGIFAALASKRFDVIQSTVSITDERKKTMIFSDPYITGGNAIFVKKGSTGIQSSDDLKGKVIGVQAGTTAEEVMTKLGTAKSIKKYTGMTEAFLDLYNGRVNAVVADPMVGRYYAAKQPNKFEAVKSNLNEEPIGVAFRKSDKSLRDAYNNAIKELKKDGTLSKISEKWFGEDIYK